MGYFYFFQGNLVSWASENAKRVMNSSTEAECYGLYEVARENFWQRQVQSELPFYDKVPATLVYEDNQSSIALAGNEGAPHKRTKHFGLNWAYFKECMKLTMVYVPTEKQAADFLTKPLTFAKFTTHRGNVMGCLQEQQHKA